MAHIYMIFDFGTDEEKAQLARHKLEAWKQAFRLDKKLLYKFERPQAEDGVQVASPDSEAKPHTPKAKGASAKTVKGAKSKAGAAAAKSKGEKEGETRPAATPAGPVKLHVRLAFSGHEKMTQERWVKRIPGEEPFSEASPQTVKANEAGFNEAESKFDALE